MPFVNDDLLDYARLRTRLPPGEPFRLDEAYRRAHLPLVAPGHPDVIAEDAARGYVMGLHETIWSLVIPIDAGVLAASPAYQALNEALRQSRFAGKIAWEIAARRRHVLHATIAGNLGRGAPPILSPEQRKGLRRARCFRIRLKGLFSGNINLGRLYLALYPELIDGENAVHRVQDALGAKRTSLYVMGLHTLADHLDVPETAALFALIERFGDVPLLETEVNSLWMLGARDDLALDSEVAESVPLS